MQTWDALPDRPGRARIVAQDDYRIDIHVDLWSATRADVRRIAQHLLEAAGASTVDAIAAVNSCDGAGG